MEFIYVVLLGMVKCGVGVVFNIVLIVGFQLIFYMVVYLVIKVFVLMFFEVVQEELYGMGVLVIVLCLGLVFIEWVEIVSVEWFSIFFV